ncbi:MAG: hypothetical protein KOO62_06310 [candidate division Zixibacteria bacterium]|nr:hypothetical protein [candidate division Zixibacteria bacterium]
MLPKGDTAGGIGNTAGCHAQTRLAGIAWLHDSSEDVFVMLSGVEAWRQSIRPKPV